MRRSDGALWAGAFGASIALHGALAATLALTPRPERVEPDITSIAIQSLASDVPDMVTATPVPQASAARAHAEQVSVAEAVAPTESAEVVARADAVKESIAAADAALSIEAVNEIEIAQAKEAQSETIAGVEGSMTALEGVPPAQRVVAALAPEAARQPIALAGAASVAAPVATPEAVLPADRFAPASAVVALVRDEAVSPAAGPNSASAEAVLPALNFDLVPTIDGQPAPSTDAGSAPGNIPGAGAIVSMPPAQGVAVASAPAVSVPRLTASPPVTAVRSPAARIEGVAAAPGPAPADTRLAMAPVRPKPPVMEAQPSVDPLQQVRNVIAEQPEQGCFLALAMPSPQAIEVDGYSETQDLLQQLQRDLAVIADASVNTRQHRITAAQCEALSFARALGPDPVAQLPITSDSAEISSGAELSGTIHNFSRKWLYLVVVDDEGKVQELDDLRANTDGTIGFSAPFTLTDGPVDTVQLLLAVASDNALETFDRHEGANARAYFAALAKEISSRPGSVEIGIAGFVIR